MRNGSAKQLMLWFIDSVFKPASRSIVQQYARRFGEAVGLVYVGGYPKSGTTWISKMIAHYLGLPWVGHSYLALGFPAVIHHHWDYHPAFDRSIFVIRDGRDVMVSIYVNMIVKGYLAVEKSLAALGAASPGCLLRRYIGRHAALRRRLHHLYGSNFDPEDIAGNMPKFIEAEMHQPFIPEVKTAWPAYVRSWMHPQGHVVTVRYEDVLDNPHSALSSVLRSFLGREPDAEDVGHVVKRFSFARMASRDPGCEDRQSFFRKGIHGDWRNYFSAESCQVFDHYAGDVLIDLGYKADHQ